MQVISDSQVCYVLIGMRSGDMASVQFVYAPAEHTFVNLLLTRVGNTPMEFLLGPAEDGVRDYAMGISTSLWEVRIRDGGLDINEILFEDYRCVDRVPA
jgi:hypothetical protein